jgi:four helix bundle protein
MKAAADCYALTTSFPRQAASGFTSQIRRASVSIAASDAEGHGRESNPHFIRFLRVAQGSQKERETHLLLCRDVGLLTTQSGGPTLQKAESKGRQRRKLIRALEERTKRSG